MLDAAWVAVMLMALFGVAMLVWFAITLVSPTNAALEIGVDRTLVVKARRGQCYLLLLDRNNPVEFIFAFEQPGARKPSAWRARWTAGDQLGNYWLGGSMPIASLPLLLPAALWVLTQWLASRRAARVGFPAR